MELPGESRYVTVTGVGTRYIVAGDGEPLLLFHSLGASVATWQDNVGPLSKVFRVYGIDLPGRGDSDKPDMAYSADTLVQFALRLIDTLGLNRPAIIGNSVGGALGRSARPERVSGLVLVDSASLGREISMYLRLVSVPGLGELLRSSRVGGTRLMLYGVFHDRSLVTRELLEELLRVRSMPGAKEVVIKVIRSAVNLFGVRKKHVLLDRLGELRVPLMLVWGAQDRILPVSQGYRAQQAAPQARLHVFEQCGHWPHMKKASVFNLAVLQFFSDRPQPGS